MRLHFAEPDEVAAGQRVFDVKLQVGCCVLKLPTGLVEQAYNRTDQSATGHGTCVASIIGAANGGQIAAKRHAANVPALQQFSPPET